MIEQRAKGAWADILAADEPQRVEPLLTAFVLPNKLVKSVGCRKVLTGSCCIVLPFVLVIFRAFPLSGGKYKRHGCDMAGTNKNIFTRRRKGREQWATPVSYTHLRAHET